MNIEKNKKATWIWISCLKLRLCLLSDGWNDVDPTETHGHRITDYDTCLLSLLLSYQPLSFLFIIFEANQIKNSTSKS